ncbi:MAG TPA: nucleotide exchange factor GrpE [Paracoccaceae bacterium]|nr:nucleotide exchange factor GrpE [Paracoccaceae bacterium]
MAQDKDNGFLDDVEAMEEAAAAAEQAEMEAEAEENDPLNVPDEEDLLAERDQLKDRVMRLLAETENLRKRGERDRREAETYGGTKLARDLLSVYDNMGRALENIDDSLREQAKALVEGIELTQRELVQVFEKHKIRRVAPEIGDKFDPKLHQAMFEAPVPGTVKGSVIQVMGTGFMIGDRLLRAAQVGVSSNPDK